MTTGERIKYRREELGLSQEELAKKVGYRNRSTIATIEMGRNELRKSKLKEFAVALDTTVAYLLGLDEHPEKVADADFELLDNFHRLNASDQATIRRMIAYMKATKGE